jgi:hypothetical protein
MSDAKSRPHVIMRPAGIEHVEEIRTLWRDHGEGNVDIRPLPEMLQAIEDKNLYVFVDMSSGKVIGTGGVYIYGKHGESYIELGSSVWKTEYRGYGFASVSVAFRSIYTMLADPGQTCVSEIYPTSKASRKILERAGFQECRPTDQMRDHALAASDAEVQHLMLVDDAIPGLAQFLKCAVTTGEVFGREGAGIIRFDAACVYRLSLLSLLDTLIAGDLSPLKHTEEAPQLNTVRTRGLVAETIAAVFSILRRPRA